MDNASTKTSIGASFWKTGICRWNPEALLLPGLPFGKDDASTLCSAEDISKGLEAGQKRLANGFGLQEVPCPGDFSIETAVRF